MNTGASTTAAPLELRHIELHGRDVVLRPLELGDAPALALAGAEGRDHYQYTPVPGTLAGAHAYVEHARSMRSAGARYPFTVLWQGRVVGSTSYYDYASFQWPAGSTLANAHGPDVFEIGYTWLAASAQRTRCNTEAKYLLLQHAFEALRVHRVRFRTDERNQRSRDAIARLGAKFEGILRGDKPATDGTLRDSACFSILRAEWPELAAELKRKLAHGSGLERT